MLQNFSMLQNFVTSGKEKLFEELTLEEKFAELQKKMDDGVAWLKANHFRSDINFQARRLIRNVGEPLDRVYEQLKKSREKS